MQIDELLKFSLLGNLFPHCIHSSYKHGNSQIELFYAGRICSLEESGQGKEMYLGVVAFPLKLAVD